MSGEIVVSKRGADGSDLTPQCHTQCGGLVEARERGDQQTFFFSGTKHIFYA